LETLFFIISSSSILGSFKSILFNSTSVEFIWDSLGISWAGDHNSAHWSRQSSADLWGRSDAWRIVLLHEIWRNSVS
jgi:hypothetical protein